MRPHQRWSPEERRTLIRLTTPFKIQLYLDTLRYNITDRTHSPRAALQHREAHCFDGALLAAAALELHGEPPLLIDLRSNGFDDDDHVLAVFRRHGCWGAIGKSNYTGCRYRDPVFRSLRELAMSYFPIYHNLRGQKTLRDYSAPLDLRRVHDLDWRWSDEDLTPLGERLEAKRHYPLISRRTERELVPVDDQTFEAETIRLDRRGAFKVRGGRLRVTL